MFRLLASLAQTATPPVAPTSTVSQLESQAEFKLAQARSLFETYGLPAVKALVLLVIGAMIAGWLSGVVRRVCERGKFDITLGRFLGNLVHWLVLAAVVIMCLSSFGVQVTSLVALLGTIGVAIGLALQGSLSHIASGVMLLIFRPFKVGDAVTAAGQTGIVEELGLFSTLLNTPDNQRIIVPNGAIVGGVIINSTHFNQRLVEINVQANPAAEIEQVRATLRRAATVDGRVEDKDPIITLYDAAGQWNVKVWAKTPEVGAVKERLLIACTAALKRADLHPSPPVSLVRQVQ